MPRFGVSSGVNPHRAVDHDAGSPFLSPASAGRVVGLAPATLSARLRAGVLPGYLLGRTWFVPREELDRTIRRAGTVVRAEAVDAVIDELLRSVPALPNTHDLEAFFGVRRRQVYEILQTPWPLEPHAPLTTRGIVRNLLARGRNGAPPLVG